MMHFEVDSKGDLVEISSILHDAKIDIEQIFLKNGKLTLEVKRLNTLSEKIIVKNYVLFKNLWIPLMLCRLEFDNVEDYELLNDQGIGIYTLNTFTIENSRLIIEFTEVTKLSVTLSGGLKGRLSDIEEINEYDKSWIVPPWWHISRERGQGDGSN